MKIPEKDKDVRSLLKTFPWIGTIILFCMGYITLKGLFTQSIRFEQRRYENVTEYVTLADRPVGYIVLMVFLLVVFCASAAYCYWRITTRKRLLKEDSASDPGDGA